MIFVTVGTQLPFDRLVSAMDEIAREMSLEVFAQTADLNTAYQHIEHKAFLSATEYEEIISRASIIVGHAGIGTILTAKKVNKPVVIYPRLASLGEHRNEHQMATARHLKEHAGVYVAETQDELRSVLQTPELISATFSNTPEKTRLLGFIHQYIYDDL